MLVVYSHIQDALTPCERLYFPTEQEATNSARDLANRLNTAIAVERHEIAWEHLTIREFTTLLLNREFRALSIERLYFVPPDPNDEQIIVYAL